MSNQHTTSLRRPLLPSSAVSSSSQTAGDIFLRLLFIISIGFLSLWANHQASKGFQLHILNDPAVADSSAGKRFSLFYISNGRAASILLNASNFVEHLLYSSQNHDHQKPAIRRVTLRLAADNSTGTDVSTAETFPGEFIIRLSPSLLMSGLARNRVDVDSVVKSAVLRGMAFVWLWDGGDSSRAPSWVIEAAVECVNRIGGFGGGSTTDDRVVVRGLMEYCERRKEGFLRRLNLTTVERAAAMPVEKLCISYKKCGSSADVDL